MFSGKSLLLAASLLKLLVLPQAALAELGSLLGNNTLGAGRGALFQREVAEDVPVRVGASLFVGREGASIFAPRVEEIVMAASQPISALTGTAVERIRQLIGHAESRRHGYDAVQYGAKRKPYKRPTEMTIGEIYKWIKDTPGQPHAIGKYQFIPATLRRLVAELGLPMEQRFSPEIQDRLADILLREAGFNRVATGEMGRHRFMHNLATIWAGLPTSSGRSYYHGYAGNKASVTWSYFDAEMSKIFPG